MQSVTANQSYANISQNLQTKENRGSNTDSQVKFEIPIAQENKEEKETKSSQMDSAVVDFLKNLREKGAARFLADFNQEKIEKLVEEYKQKLIDNMGDSPEALHDIEKLVEDFKKKLMQEMKEKREDEIKNAKNKSGINTNNLISTHLNAQKKSTPLEELLKI